MKPIHADVALLGTYKCDEAGNCWYKGTMRNFNPVMATAADLVIAETEYVVPVGEIEPENIHTFGMCVDYIVEGGGGQWLSPCLCGILAGEGVLPGGQRCAAGGAKVCCRRGEGASPPGGRPQPKHRLRKSQ